MDLNKVAVSISKNSGLTIAQVKQVIKSLSVMIFEDSAVVAKLIRNGEKACRKK